MPTQANAPGTPANADDLDLPETAVSKKEKLRNASSGALADYMDEPTSKEDNWAKRYADLRRHAQKKENDANKTVNELKAQINQLNQLSNQPMPRNPAEFEEWKNRYPEIANFIEIIADQRATSRTKELESSLVEVQEHLAKAEKERAFAQLKSLVPDLEETLGSDEWKNWFADLPESVQDQINKSEDPFEVSKMINIFKSSINHPAPRAKPASDKLGVLESAVRNTGITPSNRNIQYKFTDSQIKAMSPQEFEKMEVEIDTARRAGQILNDIGRKATVFDRR